MALAAEAREERTQESDAEPDDFVGGGWLGHGSPFLVGRAEKARGLTDGAGLCSPGRWPMEARRYPDTPAGRIAAESVWNQACQVSSSQLFNSLAAGKIATSPFDEDGVDAFRINLMAYVQECEIDFAPRPGDRHAGTPRWRLFAALLALAEDPDASDLAGFAQGVAIGVGVQMPRLPSIYKRKTKWRLEAQRASAVHEEEAIWMDNYRSATAVLPALRKTLDEDVKLGRMIKMSSEDAMSKYGSRLRIASLGASVKGTDDHGEIAIRILHDGTRGVDVNTRIKVRDQDSGPLAADVKRVLRSQADHPEPFKDLVDVKGAHRLIPVREKDWDMQACRLDGESDVYLNTVGTLGIASASYWWSRAASALVRLTHYVVAHRAHLWLLLVADDLCEMSAGPNSESALCVFLVLAAVLDFTLSWHKIHGGSLLKWVDEVDLSTHSVGITESRAAWAVKWCRDLLSKGAVRIDSMEEGVGRLSFIAGVLDWDRAFLSPLYRFLAVQQDRRATRAAASLHSLGVGLPG